MMGLLAEFRVGFMRLRIGSCCDRRASRRPRGVLAPQPRWSTRMTRQERGSKNRLRQRWHFASRPGTL